jgi:hypothetical protein
MSERPIRPTGDDPLDGHAERAGEVGLSRCDRLGRAFTGCANQGHERSSPRRSCALCSSFLGHAKLGSTVRHAGDEVDDALQLAEHIELLTNATARLPSQCQFRVS